MDLVIFITLVYVGEPVTLRLPWIAVYIITFFTRLRYSFVRDITPRLACLLPDGSTLLVTMKLGP